MTPRRPDSSRKRKSRCGGLSMKNHSLYQWYIRQDLKDRGRCLTCQQQLERDMELVPNMDRFPDVRCRDTVGERAMLFALGSELLEVMATITFREREILLLRFGFYDPGSYTLEECGRIFKITRERVRQVEAKAIWKLKHPARVRRIWAAMERCGFEFDEGEQWPKTIRHFSR